MKSRKTVLFAVLAALLALPVCASAQYLGNVRFSEPSRSHLPLDHWVEVAIDYKITAPGGARIWAVPWTDGARNPACSWLPSSPIPSGTGTVVRGFDLYDVDTVDQVRIYMIDVDTSTLVQELFVPLCLFYDDHGVYHIEMSASSPSWLRHGVNLDIGFDYASDHPGNLRITARPFTDGSLTPGYGASGSASLPPSGSYSQWFNFTQDRDVDEVRFQISTEDWSTLLYEVFVPVDLHWRSHGLANLRLNPPPPRSMVYGERVYSAYEYDAPANFELWPAPCFEGSYCYPFYFRGCPAGGYPAGTGVDSTWCYPFDVPRMLDEFRLVMEEAAGPEILTAHLGCCYRYDAHAIRDIAMTPGPAAVLGLNEHVEFNFSYSADNPGGVYIFARPYHGGQLCGDYIAHGSVVYPAGDGAGTGWFTMDSPGEVDQVRFSMRDPSTMDLIFEWFEDAQFFFGETGTATGIEPGEAPQMLALGQNYPNPFNPLTTIPFTLAAEGRVRLRVFDAMGRLVAETLDEIRPAGRNEVPFRAGDLTSGSYFYRVEANGASETRKMTVLK